MNEIAQGAPLRATELELNVARRIALGDTVHRTARRLPRKLAVIDGDVRLSYADLDALSSQFGNYLQHTGLAPGAKVALVGSNSAQFLAALYGILKAGMVWVPVNTMLGAEDVRYILAHAEVKLIVVDEGLYGHTGMQRLFDELSLPLVIMQPEGSASHSALTFAQAVRDRSTELPHALIRDHDLALIMYTSGTTGRQKGVMHSHLSVYSALISNVAELGLQSGDVTSCLLPLFHCGQYANSGAGLIAGATLVVQRGFNAQLLLEAIARERLTMVFGLPLMYAAMLEHPQRSSLDLSSLRWCSYAMAPMPRPLLQRLTSELCPNFSLNSGQTEMFPATTHFRPEQQFLKDGNYWGTAALVNDMAIMDEEGRLLPAGEVGEIVHRGPNMMLGYYKDDEATVRAQRFGWHHTSDLGKFDDDGQLLFLDRIKDMIKTGGENVPSLKVEEVLLRHPAVANAAVVGLPHPRWSEAVAAFVMLKPNLSCESAELIQHCRHLLGGFEVPKWIQFVDAFPMTPTGKIQKHVLRTAHIAQFDADPVDR